jgi:type II protein arginine methyltransferase
VPSSDDNSLAPAIAEQLAARAGDDAAALIQIGRLVAARDAAMARRLARRALALAPSDERIRTLAAEILSREVARWHFTIVDDERRNADYDAAIRGAVGSGSRVLDIGAGTGLLAMMAARAGAADVISCEMNGAIAEAAAEVVRANGLADRVRVIAKHSGDLDPAELGGPADVLVSETISNDVVGQAWLPALADARARLCTADARIIPARTIARVALANDNGLGRERMGEVDGFDLSAFNSLARTRYQLRADSDRLQLRSAAADLFDFDFQGDVMPGERASASLIADGGEINGIVQWIAIGLDAETWYENAPGGSSCWSPLFYPLREPIAPPAGTPLIVSGAYDRRRMIVWLDG